MRIENVSDTARWVAHYRAVESERPDALFHDPFARRLAGSHGEEIARNVSAGDPVSRAIVVRTVVIDELILDLIQHHGVDLVVNLAAGLDSRPWRMALPSSLRWVDVDLPGILDYKTDVLRDERPVCRYEAVRADLTQSEVAGPLLGRLAMASRRALVITEGLLIYLKSEQVATLGRALGDRQSFRWWLTDLASPRLLQYIGRSRGTLMQHAPFQFGPAEGTAFFRPLGWVEQSYRSTILEARRLGRPMPRDRLVRVLSRFMSARTRMEVYRMSGVVLLGRDTP